MRVKMNELFGTVTLVIAFFVFLFYGNVAPGIVLLALGVVVLVAGRRKAPAT